MKILDKATILKEVQRGRNSSVVKFTIALIMSLVFLIGLSFVTPIIGIFTGGIWGVLAFTLFRPTKRADYIKNDNYYILFLPVIAIEDINDADCTSRIIYFPFGHSKILNGYPSNLYVGEYYYIIVSGATQKAVAFFSRNRYELSSLLMHKLVRAHK